MAASQSSQRPRSAEAIKEDELQYGHGPLSKAELDDKYKWRPRNHSKTLPFHALFTSLFNPLNDNKKRPTGPTVARAKVGPHGPSNQSPHEVRRNIIERFISRWRNEVGDDFYPALRLIVPEKDRDRAMYGLKEKAIGKLLVKLLKISADSEDGYNLLNWKLPGHTTATRMAGDFAGRCYEVLSKREMRTDVGDMSIAKVNELLDKLSSAQKEENQLPIFTQFYNRMNAEEMMWLIRIILRQMKVGASEKTFLDLWHPDGEALFNVSSSLRRVCWELVDPNMRLTDENAPSVDLMSCFQPQLAQFQMHSFQKMVDKLGCTMDDPYFWIEEKLDGERMQLHMVDDENHPGGRRFAFWSRKAKDYTYLYGDGFEDQNSSLTRHIKNAFEDRVKNIILDGEMITWDPGLGKMVPFGTLKTAALSEQRNPFQITGARPLFRAFDCLYLNGKDLTQYTLRDRRNALEGAVKNVHQRIEVHEYQEATKTSEIDDELRKVVADASEGLVLKNPRSMYRLNSRNDDWMKVKPEYMSEFGESLDCVVIGGYYGSGHRGGNLSSFMCGLRVGQNHMDMNPGVNPEKCFSFFKVGGGFTAQDYASVWQATEGKWKTWNKKHPPTEYITLGGKDKQFERPDVWIKPSESVVLEVKAASVGPSESFGTSYTLRFPRFKKLRSDKKWDDALSVDEFLLLKARVDEESKNKEFKVDTKRHITKKLKKELSIAGNDTKVKTPYAGPKTELFEGLNFCVLTEMLHPVKKPKAELEQIIKSNGGKIFQSPTAKEDIICIGDKKLVKVASLMKSGHTCVVRGAWILDVLKQAEIDGPGRSRFLIPFEPGHMFYMTEEARMGIEGNVDPYGDSYARDVSPADLKHIFEEMIPLKNYNFSPKGFLDELEEHGKGLGEMRASMFRDRVVRFWPDGGQTMVDEQLKLDLQIIRDKFMFAGGAVAESDEEEGITHFAIVNESADTVKALREQVVVTARRLPRIVGLKWLQDSWSEGTLLDEEIYAVVA